MFRKSKRSIYLAAFLAAPRFALKFEGEGDKGAGGGGEKKDEKEPNPKKIELTEDELSERIASSTHAAIEKERKAAADKAAAAKEESDRKKAEEQGEFKSLADKEREKRESAERERDAAKLSAKGLEVKDQLRDYLAEHHTEYVGVAKYIMPLVEFDLETNPEDVAKRIKAAAEQYVKDNPRKVTGSTPSSFKNNAPSKPGGGTSDTQRTLRHRSVASSRF